MCSYRYATFTKCLLCVDDVFQGFIVEALPELQTPQGEVALAARVALRRLEHTTQYTNNVRTLQYSKILGSHMTWFKPMGKLETCYRCDITLNQT